MDSCGWGHGEGQGVSHLQCLKRHQGEVFPHFSLLHAIPAVETILGCGVGVLTFTSSGARVLQQILCNYQALWIFLLHFWRLLCPGATSAYLSQSRGPGIGLLNLWKPTLRPANAGGNYDFISKIKVAGPPLGRGLWSPGSSSARDQSGQPDLSVKEIPINYLFYRQTN